MRVSAKKKLEDYIRRKNEDRREREHLENSRDYQPEQEGYIPERGGY